MNSGRIGFDFKEMRWLGITLDQVLIWEKLYPEVDIPRVLKQDIPQWLDKKVISRDPLKVAQVARKKNWKQTIVNWLKKEQMKAVGL
jgi:hypothetical protein